MKCQQTNLPSAPETDTSSVSQGYLLYQHLWKYNCKMSPLWLCSQDVQKFERLLGNWFPRPFSPILWSVQFSAHGFWDTVNSHDLPGPIKSKWCYNIKSQEIFRTLMFFVLHAGIVDTGSASWIHLEERWSVIQGFKTSVDMSMKSDKWGETLIWIYNDVIAPFSNDEGN